MHPGKLRIRRLITKGTGTTADAVEAYRTVYPLIDAMCVETLSHGKPDHIDADAWLAAVKDLRDQFEYALELCEPVGPDPLGRSGMRPLYRHQS